ncbi:MAG: hypothetical protein ACFCU1_06485 [Sumerlaeia bacterium]
MARKESNTPAKSAINAAFWFLSIVILGFLAYSMLSPKGPSTNSNSPEGFLESYTEFVRPYLAPSTTVPNTANVEFFLSYFDADSNQFFEENVDKLAYLYYLTLNQNDAEPWPQITSGLRRGYAMKTMIGFGPLRGATVQGKTTEGNDAVLTLLSTGQTFEVSLEKINDLYKFDQFMGQLPVAAQRTDRLTLPAGAQ